MKLLEKYLDKGTLDLIVFCVMGVCENTLIFACPILWYASVSVVENGYHP